MKMNVVTYGHLYANIAKLSKQDAIHIHVHALISPLEIKERSLEDN